MASKRARAGKTVGNAINDLRTTTGNLQRQQSTSPAAANTVGATALATNSVTADALAPSSVGKGAIAPAAVGTNELGLVNQIASDSGLQLNLPGKVQLLGASYPPPAVGTSGLSIDASGNIVIATGGSGSSITFSDTAPVSPSGGAQWFCTLDGTLYTYYVDINSGQWVEYGIQSPEPNSIPAGSILPWGGSAAPPSFLLCDGSAVSRATYASLFQAIGTTYGAGDGSTTFNVPDLRGKVPVGYKSGDTNFGTLGGTGGEATHVLTVTEMPAHTHPIYPANYAATPQSGGTTVAGTALPGSLSGTSGSTGGGAAHNNIQPFTVVNYIIKFAAADSPSDSVLTTRVGAIESSRDASWTAFTPTWTATSTAPSIGNGTWSCAYKLIGAKTVAIRIALTFGSTTSGGTGSWSISLPSTLKAQGVEQDLLCKAFVAGSSNYAGFAFIAAGSNTLTPYLPASSTSAVMSPVQNASSSGTTGTGVPVVSGNYTFVTGSNFQINGVIEIQ